MAKKKKLLKKLAKAALIGGALYGGSKLLKNRRAAKLTEGDIGIGQNAPILDDYNYTPKKKLPFSPTEMWDNPWGAKEGGSAKRGVGIAKRGFGRALKGK